MNEIPPQPAFVAVVSGSEAIAEICLAERALVMVSVPWSGQDRKMRTLFAEVATQLQQLPAGRRPLCYRLEVDEDPAAESWLNSLSYPEFVLIGVGSLLWLEHGKAVAVLPSPLGEKVQSILERTLELWGNFKVK